jgi:hypothetical protein
MNFLERQLLYCTDDIRPLYSLPNPRFGSSRNAGALGILLSGRVARATFWSASAVDLYGLRSTDLARWSARYRRMPQCQARGPLASGFSGTRCQIHSGRCQRKAGLEALGGVGLELDSKSQKSLRERGLGAGFGKHRLRAGLDDDRFVADDVSLGDITHDQERDQGSHPDRFERTDSGMRVRVSSQHAQCEVAGHVGFPGRRDLHFRQGLYRLCQTSLYRGLGGVFRNTRQGQPAFCSARESRPVDKTTGLRSDQVGYLALPKARENFTSPLRRIRFFDAEQKRFWVFLTNHMGLPALTVAKLYKKRWDIELFFKWIKGNLRIKHYYGKSLNAVKTQIWIAVTTHLLVAILHKELKLPGSLHRTLQMSSVHQFEKIALHELLMKSKFRKPEAGNFN